MNLLWIAFLMGLAGSLHCFAMCGPLVLAISQGRKKTIWGQLLYQLGRIFAYLLIGALFGLVGKMLSLLVYQQGLSIISGLILLLLSLMAFFGRPVTYFFRPIANFTSAAYRKVWGKNTVWAILLSGALNGLLPCGLVYFAAITSLSYGNAVSSIAFMISFGLGTLPMMLGISVLGTLAGTHIKFSTNKLLPPITLVMAILLVVRGLGLGVPYISPKIILAADNKKVHSCCTNHISPKPGK